MSKQQLLALLLILYVRNSSCFMDHVWRAVEQVWKFATLVDEIGATGNTKLGVYESLRGENSNQKVAEHFQKMQEALYEIEHDKEFKFNALRDSLIGVNYDVLRINEHKETVLFIKEIDRTYEDFLTYITQKKIDLKILDDFTNRFLHRGLQRVRKIRKIIFLPDNTKFLNLGTVIPIVHNPSDRIAEWCGSGQTVQNLLVTLFQIIMATEMKIYIMQVFSYRYEHVGDNKWESMISNLRTDMKEQVEKYLHAFANSIEVIDSAYLRPCDPKRYSWIQNESFYELNGFHDMGIFKYVESNCQYESCSLMWDHYRDKCGVQWFDTRTKCNGQVLGCAWVGEMTSCVLKEGPRKYEWVTSSVMGNFGRNRHHCPQDSSYIIRTTEPGRPKYWSSCRCKCLKGKGTIYLGQLGSRKNLNYVITGLRFKFNEDNILFLQPAEGKLEANGYISHSSWVPLPKVIDDKDIGAINKNRKSFFFADLRLPAGYALTGISFVAFPRGRKVKISGYSIEISGVPFDYKTGILNALPTSEKTRSVITLDIMKALPFKKNHPATTPSYLINEPSPASYNYVKLQQMTLGAEFEPLMLPLLDSVPLLTSPPSPLGGIGIFHKGSEDHSGFISLRLYSIDYKLYVTEFMEMYGKNGKKMWNI